MSAIKKLAGQTAIYGLSSIVGRVLNYFLVPLHTGIFSTSEYGVVSEFYAWVAFLTIVLTFGLETTFFRFVNKAQDKEKVFNQAFSLVLVMNVIFLALVIPFSQQIANWMLFPDCAHYVVWFACILSFDAISSILLAKLRFQEKAGRFALIQLVSVAVNIGLNLVFLLWLFDDPDTMSISWIFMANLAASVIKPFFLPRELSSFRFTMDRKLAASMIMFALPLAIAGLAGIVNETIDRILLKRLLLADGLAYSPNAAEAAEFAQSQVGIYSANYKLSILITLFIQAFRYAAEPFFFSQAKSEDRNKIYSRVMTWFVIVVMAMFLIISLNLDLLKWFIPNTDFHVGLHIVPWLLLANCCLGIYYNQSIWYKLADKTMFGAYIAIGGALITVILNLVLIPEEGYEGAAWTTFVCYFSMMIASWILGQIYFPIRYNLRKISLYCFAAVGFYLLARAISPDSAITSYILRATLIAAFLAIVYWMEIAKQKLPTERK